MTIRNLSRFLMALPFSWPAVTWAWRGLSGQRREWGRILYYHGVPDSAAGAFEDQMRFLASHYTVVSLPDMVRHLSEGTIDGRWVALSFDDGFLNNYVNAFPILKRLGLPATFFVSTGFIDRSGDAKAEARFCTERFQTRWTPAMSWDHLKEMVDAGYSIGSHGVRHCRQVRLEKEELMEEVEASKRRIEEVLAVPCRYLAYPFGRWNDVDGLAVARTRQAGYEAFFSAVRGFNTPGADSFLFLRDHVMPSWPPGALRMVIEGGLDLWHRRGQSCLSHFDCIDSDWPGNRMIGDP